MPSFQSNRRSSALVPWTARVGTTPFGRSPLMREMAEKVRKWCIINAAMRPNDIPQPQMAVVPVVHKLLEQNRRMYDRWGLAWPEHFRMYHTMQMSVPYLEKLDQYARFYERVLSDSQFKLQLKYWIFENRHVPV